MLVPEMCCQGITVFEETSVGRAVIEDANIREHVREDVLPIRN